MAMGVKHYLKDGKEHKGGAHKMPDGSLHSGAKHTAKSKPLFHYGDLSPKSKGKARTSWK
jgi:hypothetical protein